MHHDGDGVIQICCELVCDGGSAIDTLLLATAKYYVHNNCFCISLHAANDSVRTSRLDEVSERHIQYLHEDYSTSKQ